METKEFKILVPEGYEIDKENSTFECIKFKKKNLTNYYDILNSYNNFLVKMISINNTFTAKLTAINKLMIVAKYLNEGWVPNFKNEAKYFISICNKNTLEIDSVFSFNCSLVYFKSEELAQKAIEILGKETIRQALSVDY